MVNLISIRENLRTTTILCLKRRWFLLNVLLIPILFSPVIKAQPLSKLQKQKTEAGFAQRLDQNSADTAMLFTLKVHSLAEWKRCIDNSQNISTLSYFETAQTFVVKTKPSVLKRLLNCDAVIFADDVKQATEELLLGFVDYSSNKISLIQSEYPQFNGSNLVISVKENKFDTTDIDFKGRLTASAFAPLNTTGHASSMATIIAGGGNTWNYTLGAAWKANLSSASFQNLLPEPLLYYQQPAISIQNHSYGTLVENFYGAEASAYDASVVAIPTLVHIFSAGNSGTLTPGTGRYTGIPGYANTTGNFKQAKNIITVGHTDSFYTVLAPSSKGPAFDGRIKPELVAFGEDGSSGAAALVSGITAVLQQTYQQLFGIMPGAALIKSILLNSADDVDLPGIDFASGYGSVNAYKGLQTILQNRFFNSSVSGSNTVTFPITVAPGTKQLKLTLVWTDPSAAPNAGKALVHDLDLELINNTTTETWLPWVLNNFPHKDSLQLPAVRKRDTLHNAEQISIDLPEAGNYTVKVKGNLSATSVQNFSIAWQTDSVNVFKWNYPAKNDHLTPSVSNVLRWQSTYPVNGILELSTNNGVSWQTIDNNVTLTAGYYKFTPSSFNQPALLRMKIGSDVFVSDTFTISNRLLTNVGFNCADSFLISWQKIPGIGQYQVYKMGSKYLEPLVVTSDTFFIKEKLNNPALHYAVAPLVNSKPLLRSYTFDYSTQGTECYIRSFIAGFNSSNFVTLELLLSSTLRVKSVVFEKRIPGGFIPVYSTGSVTGLQYNFTDTSIKTGTNSYRAYVELQDGRKFYSDEAVIYFTPANIITIYPNPVPRNGVLFLLAKPEELITFQLINSNGQVVVQQLINKFPEQLKLSNMQPGIYYYRLLKQNQKTGSGKLVIQ